MELADAVHCLRDYPVAAMGPLGFRSRGDCSVLTLSVLTLSVLTRRRS